MNRRQLLQNSSLALGSILATNLLSCTTKKPQNMSAINPKISLAQWSLNRAFFASTLDPVDFAKIARQTYHIDAIEYVNQFYINQATNLSFWKEMKSRADDQGVKSLLIMVDDEGELGSSDPKIRKEAITNHYKWVQAAHHLGCHSIRVNAFGDDDVNLFKNAMIHSMTELCNFAKQYDISIIIENHGLHSSNAQLIVEIIQTVDLPNFGSFPDFGNWCTSAKWGSTQIACKQSYDPVQGVKELLPYAKAVSAKSYNFNDKGNQDILPYDQLIDAVKSLNYSGYIGIEYEGKNLSEHEGILATHALINKCWIKT